MPLGPTARRTAEGLLDSSRFVQFAAGHCWIISSEKCADQPPEPGRVRSAPQGDAPWRDEQVAVGRAQDLVDEVGHQDLAGAGERADASGEVDAQAERHAGGVEQRLAEVDADAHLGASSRSCTRFEDRSSDWMAHAAAIDAAQAKRTARALRRRWCSPAILRMP